MAHHPFLNIAISAVKRAEKIITPAFDQLHTLEVIQKRDNDLVTVVDLEVEQIIIDCIKQAYPDHGILGEESGEHPGSETVWIIDPIDATKNFIHGFPHFAISIAVQHQGKIEHGLVYDPIKKDLFTASKGRGAQLNGHRIRVASLRTLDQALIATDFPLRQKEKLADFLKPFTTILQNCGGMRSAGCASLDLAYVACGRLDGYFEFGLQIWDIAAGSLLVREAGGLVGDFDGSEKYLETGNIVAGNPKVFKNLVQVLAHSL